MDEIIRQYNPIYQELSEIIGEENMLKIYENFSGLQISYSSRLYSKEYIQQQIRERFDGTNQKQLAKEFGYTLRYFNQLIKELDL